MSGPPGTEHLTDAEFETLMTSHGHRWGASSFLSLAHFPPVCMRCLTKFNQPAAAEDCRPFDPPLATDPGPAGEKPR